MSTTKQHHILGATGAMRRAMRDNGAKVVAAHDLGAPHQLDRVLWAEGGYRATRDGGSGHKPENPTVACRNHLSAREPAQPQFRARVIKRAPLVDLSDPFEIASLIALVIGVVVLVWMLSGWLG